MADSPQEESMLSWYAAEMGALTQVPGAWKPESAMPEREAVRAEIERLATSQAAFLVLAQRRRMLEVLQPIAFGESASANTRDDEQMAGAIADALGTELAEVTHQMALTLLDESDKSELDQMFYWFQLLTRLKADG
jgi:hypothetical protein